MGEDMGRDQVQWPNGGAVGLDGEVRSQAKFLGFPKDMSVS